MRRSVMGFVIFVGCLNSCILPPDSPLSPVVNGFPSTGQTASLVIGQENFTDTAVGQFMIPAGNPVMAGGHGYFPDTSHHRILGFTTTPTGSGATADFALGQPTMTPSSSPATLGASSLNYPKSLSSDGTRLAVADSFNNRVLIWTSLPTTTGQSAQVVLGQGDFTSSAYGCSSTGLGSPEGVCLAGGKLVVADSMNNRVLIWNSVPTVSGQAADVVLGQPDFTHGEGNRSQANPGADTLSYPSDVWTDGTRLIVADYNNYRVLIWKSFPTVHGQAADVVLLQDQFSTKNSGCTQSRAKQPSRMAFNGESLAVVDSMNQRVLFWTGLPSVSGTPADRVLGQINFTSSGSASAGSGSFNTPNGLFFTSSLLMVTDSNNHRFLVFSKNP